MSVYGEVLSTKPRRHCYKVNRIIIINAIHLQDSRYNPV